MSRELVAFLIAVSGVNVAAVLMGSLRVGRTLGVFETTQHGFQRALDAMAFEMAQIRRDSVETAKLLAGAVQQLDGIETRVGLLERRD